MDRAVPTTARKDDRNEKAFFENADSDLKPVTVPIKIRPPFRFEAGHDSNQRPSGFRL